jgi:hypothetical protein
VRGEVVADEAAYALVARVRLGVDPLRRPGEVEADVARVDLGGDVAGRALHRHVACVRVDLDRDAGRCADVEVRRAEDSVTAVALEVQDAVAYTRTVGFENSQLVVRFTSTPEPPPAVSSTFPALPSTTIRCTGTAIRSCFVCSFPGVSRCG